MLDYEFTTDAQRSSDPRKNIFLRRQLCGQQTSISTDFCSTCICHLVSLLPLSPFSPVPHVSAILVFLCLSEDLVRNTFHPRHPFISKIHLFPIGYFPATHGSHVQNIYLILLSIDEDNSNCILTYCLTPAPRDSMVTPPSPNTTPLACPLTGSLGTSLHLHRGRHSSLQQSSAENSLLSLLHVCLFFL